MSERRPKPTTLQLSVGRDQPGSEYVVGRLRLSRHFDTPMIAAVDVSTAYARQLMLREESVLAPGWAPLFVCQCCGDLACGAIAVRVERRPAGFVWAAFRYAGPGTISSVVSPYMERTGPFVFEPTAYCSVLSS